jgi:O-antigen biosynthesis protein WbqP
MIRFLDVLLSLLGLVFCSPLLVLLFIIGFIDTGSPIFIQQRLGRNQQTFMLFKFRSMHVNTVSVSTHLIHRDSITPFGQFLRKSKLDELPQLWNVLIGEMSLVGPRPGLKNQTDLIHEREIRGVYSARPGITGLAQVNKIDMSSPVLLAETDQQMLQTLSLSSYFKYILMTLTGKGSGDRIKGHN